MSAVPKSGRGSSSSKVQKKISQGVDGGAADDAALDEAIKRVDQKKERYEDAQYDWEGLVIMCSDLNLNLLTTRTQWDRQSPRGCSMRAVRFSRKDDPSGAQHQSTMHAIVKGQSRGLTADDMNVRNAQMRRKAQLRQPKGMIVNHNTERIIIESFFIYLKGLIPGLFGDTGGDPHIAHLREFRLMDVGLVTVPRMTQNGETLFRAMQFKTTGRVEGDEGQLKTSTKYKKIAKYITNEGGAFVAVAWTIGKHPIVYFVF